MRIDQSSLSARIFKKYKVLKPEKKIHVLRSYGNRDKDDNLFRKILKDQCASLDLDSGAFSKNNRQQGSGLDITFNGYMQYVKTYGAYYGRIYNYDCYFDDEGFDTNIFYQKRMEDAGLTPVPVVHSIYNDEIEHYIQCRYKIVALGSKQITDFGTLSYVMDKFKGTKIKIHLFGNASFEFLTSFPIYSCDASTWAMTGKFGDIKWWNPNKMAPNQTDKIYIEEYIPPRPNVKLLSEYEYRQELLEYLYSELDVTEDDLIGPEGTYYKQIVNLHYYLKYEEVVNQIHRQKGFWTAE